MGSRGRIEGFIVGKRGKRGAKKIFVVGTDLFPESCKAVSDQPSAISISPQRRKERGDSDPIVYFFVQRFSIFFRRGERRFRSDWMRLTAWLTLLG